MIIPARRLIWYLIGMFDVTAFEGMGGVDSSRSHGILISFYLPMLQCLGTVNLSNYLFDLLYLSYVNGIKINNKIK